MQWSTTERFMTTTMLRSLRTRTARIHCSVQTVSDRFLVGRLFVPETYIVENIAKQDGVEPRLNRTRKWGTSAIPSSWTSPASASVSIIVGYEYTVRVGNASMRNMCSHPHHGNMGWVSEWSAIHYQGKSKLVSFKGTLNQFQYMDIIEQYSLPFARQTFLDKCTPVKDTSMQRMALLERCLVTDVFTKWQSRQLHEIRLFLCRPTILPLLTQRHCQARPMVQDTCMTSNSTMEIQYVHKWIRIPTVMQCRTNTGVPTKI